jgi:hypothetical protein
MVHIEFTPSFEGGYHCKSGRTSHDSEHHFSGLIQGQDVVLGPDLLYREYRQKKPGTFDSLRLLIVGQDLWHASEMTRHKPESSRESPISRGFG